MRHIFSLNLWRLTHTYIIFFKVLNNQIRVVYEHFTINQILTQDRMFLSQNPLVLKTRHFFACVIVNETRFNYNTFPLQSYLYQNYLWHSKFNVPHVTIIWTLFFFWLRKDFMKTNFIFVLFCVTNLQISSLFIIKVKVFLSVFS